MCLAIVKLKGVSIPEEHLQEGWNNNNHGAGFACVDNDGEFIIHKFMTYASFIERYREVEALYGDTSDFLIHFRIASKGEKILSNCHPFVVDADRVIIHNGTIYNIYIDKKDIRSDTKVFAEDWLSELPPDWEDNKIIPLMLEDFLGSYSKLCLLHRTKGIYIFNEDKGHWLDNIWYSNESYKKRNVPAIIYSHRVDTFYSFKWERMVSAEESKHMTSKEIDEHRNWDRLVSNTSNNGSSWIQCDLCRGYDLETSMVDMDGDHKGQQWCWDCYKKSETCECCGKVYPEDKVDLYWNAEEGAEINLCDGCAPYLNCIEVEKENKSSDEEQESKVA